MIAKSSVAKDRLSDSRADAIDLKPKQCIDLAIRAAFPLPRTGAFKDLIAAIDAAERKVLA